MGWGYFGFFKLHWGDLGGQKDWIKEIGFSHITYLNFRELLGVFDKVRVWFFHSRRKVSQFGQFLRPAIRFTTQLPHTPGGVFTQKIKEDKRCNGGFNFGKTWKLYLIAAKLVKLLLFGFDYKLKNIRIKIRYFHINIIFQEQCSNYKITKLQNLFQFSN